MVATLVTQGIDYFTRFMLLLSNLGQQRLHLFTNNRVPQVNDGVAQYTECTQGGYAAITLNGNLWNGSTVNGIATYTYPAQLFTLNADPAPQTIFGYYVTDLSNSVLLYAEQFPAPYTPPVTGGSLSVGLVWQDKQC